jgi:hypothetical protein
MTPKGPEVADIAREAVRIFEMLESRFLSI